ncbi:MAG: hypothetical protein Q4C38_03010 [bacterium]|nr:hypothetical protein [bacterium]
MDYKYQRRQIFGKRLKVPKHILNKVYNCTLFFNEFIEYQLDDKIPTSCIIESDRRILEKFGIDRCKELDWELINKRIYNNDINFRDILMSIDSQTDDINLALYELVKDQIKPSDYSPKMAKLYQDRLFEIDYEKYDYSESRTRALKSNFNDGEVSLKEIISNWDLFKDKDLSYCLLNDENNTNHITDGDLKRFMSDYGNLAPLIIENNDIYVFINNLSNLSSDEEKSNYLKQFTDDILSNTKRQYGDYRSSIKLTDEQYREIFKYSSLEDYLKMFNEQRATPIIEELKSLPQDYVFNMSIPFSELLNYDVLSFIGTYGLKNIIDFDNECGHFFTKNNCEMLKLMNNMYLHYSGNEHDPNKTIHTKKNIDENGNYIDRPYTKDEFYEAMKRMIIYGPSDWNYADKAPDYRDMIGEFRVRNAELFISEEAPEELQKMFYTKSITPQLLLEHPEYIQFLIGKDLRTCFKDREIQVEGSNGLYGYENIYKFLGSKTDFSGLMNFITEYSDVLDIVFDSRMSDYYQYEIKFSNNDDMNQVHNRINETLRKLIIEKGLTYPTHIPKELISKYPSMFLDKNAPQELQEAFYGRTITSEFILSNPTYRNYLNGVDLECLFKYMPVGIMPKNYLGDIASTGSLGHKRIRENINFVNALKQTFGESDALDVMLIYGKYVEQVYKANNLKNFLYNPEFTQDGFLDEVDKTILQNIIEGNMKYDENIPSHFKNNNPTLFLGADAPQELQEAFYGRTITSEFILSNPTYRNYLNGVDLECLFKYMPVGIMPKNYLGDIASTGSLGHKRIRENINFVNALKQTFGESDALDVMLIYGKYVEQVYKANNLKNFLYNPEFTQDGFLDEVDKTILQNIIEGNMKYDENIPSHFKNNNPTLFLGADVPQEIKDKFYNREFTLKDFNDNPELLNIFENTNIACAFSETMSWIIPLFNDSENFKTGNYNRMKVITAYSKIQDVELEKAFKEYVMEFGTNIDAEKIEYVSEVLSRLSLSNSSEIFTFRKELATQILKSNNPLESLGKIEDVFIRNNIPTVGKIYSCFEILHPDFQGFNVDCSMISPVLKESSTMSKKVTVFSDLIKSSFGSNNRSVNAYLKNIEFGSNLYESIKSGQIQFDSLGESEMRELTTFCSHLATLYNNTMKAKKSNETFKSTGYVLTDILELSKKLSPDGTLDYNLADRVIRMFCGFAGIDTLEQAKEYIERKVKNADSRNRDASSSDMVLEQGDFIKGIGDITYLRNILQNGSVSKEYLGSSACSDATPLDTDISMIMSSDGTIREKMNATAASGYGPIWFVLKNDDRFITTRTSSETLEAKRDMSKMEVFYTGVLGQGHYGIRTGFASSEINYIVMDNYDPRVGLEIAMNGFYIPVANKEGKILFTPKDYDELRAKMSGLSYFEEDNYSFSKNLITEETEYFAEQIEQSNYEVQAKREKINSIIKKSLEELGLHLKTNIDGDLTEGFVELIDTGSTGRGTNMPGDGDFDYMMRLDKTILSNPTRLNELKQTILRNLGRENSSGLTGDGDFRLKSVQIDTDMSVDIDITFTEKTDKVSYSTDMALQDRLATIQRNDPKKYKYVVANILLAKQVLKQAEAYKPNRGEIPQGGLGGVGIENWILQNGGSFIDAARSFVEAADGKSFSKFQSTYQIWNFGENHLAARRGEYDHNNFITNNMSEAGYQKMVVALKEYLKTMEISQVQTEGIKR